MAQNKSENATTEPDGFPASRSAASSPKLSSSVAGRPAVNTPSDRRLPSSLPSSPKYQMYDHGNLPPSAKATTVNAGQRMQRRLPVSAPASPKMEEMGPPRDIREETDQVETIPLTTSVFAHSSKGALPQISPKGATVVAQRARNEFPFERRAGSAFILEHTPAAPTSARKLSITASPKDNSREVVSSRDSRLDKSPSTRLDERRSSIMPSPPLQSTARAKSASPRARAVSHDTMSDYPIPEVVSSPLSSGVDMWSMERRANHTNGSM